MVIDWKELQPRLVERLQKLREEELAYNKKVKLSKRWEAFCHQFKCWNEVQTIEPFLLPHVVDLVVRAPFKDIVFTPSLEDGDFTVDEIDRVAKEWMADRDSRILSLLPGELQATLTDENGPHEKVAPLQKLPLASLFFRGKSVGLKTVDQVYGRRLSLYDYDRITVDRELRSHFIELRINQRPWDWDCYDLEFDLRTHEIAKDVIMLFGKDPLTATLSEMSHCEQIFECLTCDDASSEWLRVKGTWSDVVCPSVYFAVYTNPGARSCMIICIQKMKKIRNFCRKDGPSESRRKTQPNSPSCFLTNFKQYLIQSSYILCYVIHKFTTM